MTVSRKEQPRPLAQVLGAILLICLIAGPILYQRLSPGNGSSVSTTAGGAPGVPTLSPNEALIRYGFALTEVSHKAHIDFTHQVPRLDPKLEHIAPEVASMGVGVSIVDYDRDGWPDIFVTNSAQGSKCQMLHNNHDGTFTDVAPQMGLADLNQPGTGVCMGAVWGDYDNDGYEDLLVYKWGKPMLFHNDGGKKFTDVTAQAGLPAHVNANSALWVDYDTDGKLDLLICGYYPDNVDLFQLANTHMMPDSFEYANNGGRKYLMKNLGGGRFQDVTKEMGIDSHRWTLACTAADLRGTGYPDLFLANDYGVSELYANLRGHGFKEIAKQANIATRPKSGMSAEVGDILNQGQYAVYVSNISEEGQLVQGNNLWMPRSGTKGDAVQYDNVATEMGIELGGWSFGAQFGDLNNDGSLDLYVTNGLYSGDPNQSYWYDFGKVAGGNERIISDAANWPAVRGRSHSGRQQKKVWLGDGTGRFNEVSQMVGATDRYDGRSVALADLFNNGALDVLVGNQNGPLLLYRNTVDPANQWIEFHLEGTLSNRSAIGAQLTLYWNGQKQIQTVNGGSGFCAQNDRRLHYGLGKSPKLEKAEIRWPSGKTQTLTALNLNRVNEVKEP